MSTASALAEAYAHCEAIARAHEKDRWLAALFAPEAARPHLHALIAFDHEISHVRSAVREPIAGEMRLVWWREAATGLREGEAAGHPTLRAFNDTVAKFQLPRHLIENAVAARQFDLYDDPMPSLNDLEGYLGETVSYAFQLAALVLAEGRDVGAADASGHAGVAYGIARLLRASPETSARGQVYLPADILTRHGASTDDIRQRRATPNVAAAIRTLVEVARKHLLDAESHVAKLPREVAPAYALLAIVPPYLKALEKATSAPFATEVEVAQWRRQWALWRWSKRG